MLHKTDSYSSILSRAEIQKTRRTKSDNIAALNLSLARRYGGPCIDDSWKGI